MKTLQTSDGHKFGTLTSRDYYHFFDALAVLQKKKFTLVDAEELSDLLLQPEFKNLRNRKSNVATHTANGFVYAPNGEVLVVSRDKNPIVKRYEETIGKFNEFSFPDHPEYQKVLEATSGKDYSSTGTVHDALLRRRMALAPEALFPMVKTISEYARCHGVSVVLPMYFNPQAYHSADKVKRKNGEPYFISRIKDVSRFSGFGARDNLTDKDLADLLEVASSDMEKARESGVLLVPRDALQEINPLAYLYERKDRKNDSEPYFSQVNVPANKLSQHPLTAFLFGGCAERFSEYLLQKKVEVLPVTITDKSYMAKQTTAMVKPVIYNIDRPQISGAGQDGLYHAQIFGIRQ